MTTSNEMAYPAFDDRGECNSDATGLTKREYFAAMAMQGICSAEADNEEPMIFKNVAAASVAVADALINELNKPKS